MLDLLRALKWYPDLYTGGRARRSRALCVVHGNCQAEPLRRMLESSPAFSQLYTAVRVPPVQAITARQADLLRRLLAKTVLLITQPVRQGYRGLGIGNADLEACLGAHGRVLRFPSLYFEAYHPFQVYVGADGEHVAAPITEYHDLRTLFAASQPWAIDAGVEWVSHFRSSAEAIRANAQRSLDELRSRERQLDVSVSALLERRLGGGRVEFFTVNHPSRDILAGVANQVHERLGMTPPERATGPEPLDMIRPPMDADVVAALALDVDPRRSWRISGREYASSDVVRQQLAWYEDNPGVVAMGLAKHGQRLADLAIHH